MQLHSSLYEKSHHVLVIFKLTLSFLPQYPVCLEEYYLILRCPGRRDLWHAHSSGCKVLVAPLQVK